MAGSDQYVKTDLFDLAARNVYPGATAPTGTCIKRHELQCMQCIYCTDDRVGTVYAQDLA